MKTLSIVGARPQFVKASVVCRALAESGNKSLLVHTGQHYDDTMSAVFFRELEILEADYNLAVGSGPHGQQTGRMLEKIEQVLLVERPDWTLVYGDTNSTLAGTLAAVKLHIPVAHVEAGLRSFNRTMPEEHNRVLTDHCSDLLLCPTTTAIRNLANEGIKDGVHLVGDTMYDAILQFSALARTRSSILDSLSLETGSYILATIHRPANVDHPEVLNGIIEAFLQLGQTVVFAVHPRTRARIADLGGTVAGALRDPLMRIIDPIGYLDMLMLTQNASRVITDSGGLQKEAYLLGVPCITLRSETEWIETVEAGWNMLVGTDREKILKAARLPRPNQQTTGSLFGDGNAAHHIVDALRDGFSQSNGRRPSTGF